MEQFAKNFEKVITFELRGFFGKNRLQKFWRLTRTSYVMYNLLKLYEKNARKDHVICDVGCGPGIVASFFARRGFNIVGIDIIEPLIVFAKKLFARQGLEGKFVTADIMRSSPILDSIHCNTIICIDAIEHFSDPRKSIQGFKKLLAENGGKIFLTTPNFGNPVFTLMERMWDVVGKTPGWSQLHITRLGLNQYKRLFIQEGFEIEDAGTFMLISPMLAIISTRLARLVSKLEQHLFKKIPIGFMLYFTLNIENQG
ncbi:MAG TPA: class I SAM-dependent methyltransferase [Candidatus Lokiarchaeia archaeon]|nr:class I SAM-dependent methyltransferase [Candidatus Lokiarchaeia archaeon]